MQKNILAIDNQQITFLIQKLLHQTGVQHIWSTFDPIFWCHQEESWFLLIFSKSKSLISTWVQSSSYKELKVLYLKSNLSLWAVAVFQIVQRTNLDRVVSSQITVFGSDECLFFFFNRLFLFLFFYYFFSCPLSSEDRKIWQSVTQSHRRTPLER